MIPWCRMEKDTNFTISKTLFFLDISLHNRLIWCHNIQTHVIIRTSGLYRKTTYTNTHIYLTYCIYNNENNKTCVITRNDYFCISLYSSSAPSYTRIQSYHQKCQKIWYLTPWLIQPWLIFDTPISSKRSSNLSKSKKNKKLYEYVWINLCVHL